MASTALCGAFARAADKTNVLFIAIDDLNHWVGHLGRHPQTKTPNIDLLAKQGMTFTRAYCTAPACNPSRVSLMSGQRPSTTGGYLNSQNWRPEISEDTPVIPKRRREHCRGLDAFRWVVKRTLSWLHNFRRLRIRWERRDDIHEAFMTIAEALVCFSILKMGLC